MDWLQLQLHEVWRGCVVLRDPGQAEGHRHVDPQRTSARRVSPNSMPNRPGKNLDPNPSPVAAVWHTLASSHSDGDTGPLGPRWLLRNIWKCTLSLRPNMKLWAQASSLGTPRKPEKSKDLVLWASHGHNLFVDNLVSTETPSCLNK